MQRRAHLVTLQTLYFLKRVVSRLGGKFRSKTGVFPTSCLKAKML